MSGKTPREKRGILIIVQNLPVPFDRRVWQEATSLRKAGFQVAVICPKKKIYTRTYEQLEGVDIYRYPMLYEADGGVAGYFVEFVYCWLATLVLASFAFLRRRFHVIHACNPPDTFFALASLFRPLGVKFVFDHHDLCPEMFVAKGHQRGGLLYSGLLFLERKTLQAADMVIAVNQSHRQIALDRGQISGEKVKIVRSGPRASWSEIQRHDPALKKGRRFLAMYLGEMCEQDGVDYLLRAIAKYKDSFGPQDTLFALVGGGPHHRKLSQLAADMGLSEMVDFTGRVSDEELWKYLSTADVCLDPDPLTEWSDLSTMNKMIEYLAFGRPVVAFALREHRHTAGDCAVFVEPNNIDAFAGQMRALLLDESTRHRMGRSGQLRFRNLLAWEHSERVLIESYEHLLGPRVESDRSRESDLEVEPT